MEEECDAFTGETNHIYHVNPSLKTELIGKHKNTMLNILVDNLLLVKEQHYNVDAFKPDSVRKRSLAYLQNSYDIHNIFMALFELRCEANIDKYKNAKDEPSDEDWTIYKIVQSIRKSAEFYDLDKKRQKEYKAEVIEEFFKKNAFYKNSLYADTHKHAQCMRNWRLKPVIVDDE